MEETLEIINYNFYRLQAKVGSREAKEESRERQRQSIYGAQ